MKFKVGDIIEDGITTDEVIEVNHDHYILKCINAISVGYKRHVGETAEYKFDTNVMAKYKLTKELIWNKEMTEIINGT